MRARKRTLVMRSRFAAWWNYSESFNCLNNTKEFDEKETNQLWFSLVDMYARIS